MANDSLIPINTTTSNSTPDAQPGGQATAVEHKEGGTMIPENIKDMSTDQVLDAMEDLDNEAMVGFIRQAALVPDLEKSLAQGHNLVTLLTEETRTLRVELEDRPDVTDENTSLWKENEALKAELRATREVGLTPPAVAETGFNSFVFRDKPMEAAYVANDIVIGGQILGRFVVTYRDKKASLNHQMWLTPAGVEHFRAVGLEAIEQVGGMVKLSTEVPKERYINIAVSGPYRRAKSVDEDVTLTGVKPLDDVVGAAYNGARAVLRGVGII